MSWIKDIYYLNRLRKLQEKVEEKEKVVTKLNCKLRDLEYDIMQQHIKDSQKSKPNFQEILDDDSPNMIRLKTLLFTEGNRRDFYVKELANVSSEVIICKHELGVR